MNKKIEDTNEKIYNAFSEVLLLKDYNDVRIQDVLDKSGVARSTFYAHYKTKEDLLKSVCTTIFSHVFSHVLKEEKSHDFSSSSICDYKHFITHIFYHIKDESRLIHAILLSQSKAIFLDYMREGVREFATACVVNGFVDLKGLPEKLKVRSVIESFILIIEYWSDAGFSDTPEKLTDYFLKLNV